MRSVSEQTVVTHEGIDAANRRFEAAFAAGDPGGAARGAYTRQARVLPPGAPLIRGREEAAGFWEAAAGQMGIRAIELETLELEVHGEHAHEMGRGVLSLEGGQRVTAKYVVIWKQEDGAWRWDVDIWNTDA